MELLVLDAVEINRLLQPADVVQAVEDAFKAYGQGEARMPPKIYLDVPRGDFRAMPAYLPGAAGVKWVNVHTGNRESGRLPTVMGMMIYSDPDTGEPLAVLDATLITRLRTGAAAAVATRALARPDSRVLALVGCGGQAIGFLRMMLEVMTPDRLLLSDVVRENALAVAAHFRQFAPEILDVEDACRAAHVLCTVTPTREPFVRRAWIRPGTHINAMGADAPGKQELEIDLLLAVRVFVDDWAQAVHSGEINVPHAQDRFDRPVTTLPDVLIGAAPGRIARDEITVFDSTGLAIQDLAVARLAIEQARQRGMGRRLPFALEPDETA